MFLPFLLPVVVARLATQEITEPSEELRLSLVTLLTSIVGLCKIHMSPYLNDMVLILQRTIVDPFPEVKKVGCWKMGVAACRHMKLVSLENQIMIYA